MIVEFCNVLEEVVSALAWSAIGFVAGYLTCRLRSDIQEIKEAVVADVEGSAAERHSGEVRREDRSKRTQWQTVAIGVFIILLSIFTAGQTWYSSGRDREIVEESKRITECQAQYNSDLAKVTIKRAEYAAEDRKALTNMVSTVLTGPTPQIRKRAIERYLEITSMNERLRSQNPLPKLEDRQCG